MAQTPEEFKRRVDADLKRAAEAFVGTTPLSKKKPVVVPKPLEPVELTPLPTRPYYWPFDTEQEYLDARDADTKKQVGEIENRDIRAGKVSWTAVWYRLTQGGGWWQLLLGGAGAFAISKLVGCG